MNKKFFSLFGLAMVLSIAIHLASSSTVRAAQVTYFFAEESTGTPTPKASWELVDTPITLNLWTKVSVQMNISDYFRTECDTYYSYSGGITAGDLNIDRNISGGWYGAMEGGWSDISGPDGIRLFGFAYPLEGPAFEEGYFLLGSITLSANKADSPIKGEFTMWDQGSFSSISHDGGTPVSIPTRFTTTRVTVTAAPSVPEPGTWAMLAGAALVGGAWMRRRKNIAVR